MIALEGLHHKMQREDGAKMHLGTHPGTGAVDF